MSAREVKQSGSLNEAQALSAFELFQGAGLAFGSHRATERGPGIPRRSRILPSGRIGAPAFSSGTRAGADVSKSRKKEIDYQRVGACGGVRGDGVRGAVRLPLHGASPDSLAHPDLATRSGREVARRISGCHAKAS